MPQLENSGQLLYRVTIQLPSTPQIVVPITDPNYWYKATRNVKNEIVKAAGELSLIIAFYYLLQVGECTKPHYVYRNNKKIRATRTQQFTVGNVGFFRDGKILPRSSSLDVLLIADSATLKITNQKNFVFQVALVDNENCAVKALAHRVHHILSNGGDNTSLICAVFDKEEQVRKFGPQFDPKILSNWYDYLQHTYNYTNKTLQ